MSVTPGVAAPSDAAPRAASLDVSRIRADFPVLAEQVHGKPLVYLDNAATGQKPRAVIDAITNFYQHGNANIHRGVHHLSVQATQAYDHTRAVVRDFIGAASEREIIFVRGTTEGINLVAQSYARTFLKAGDEILITGMEHHSNIVPWQLVAGQTGAVLRVASISDAGEVDPASYHGLLSERTRLVALGHVSNALGTVNPVKEMVALAHKVGAKVLVDGAQAAPHLPIDVQDLGCDFYVFSGHKAFGPTGIGALYGREELLEKMPPWQGGGDMIASVSFEGTTFAELPAKFEAGTPAIAEVIGLAEALNYLARVGHPAMAAHEADLLRYAEEQLAQVPGLHLVGAGAPQRTGVVSFVMDGAHPHDIGTVLDREGIAIRAGHHCAQPVMERYGVPATARASFALYNTREEVDALIRGLRRVRAIFG